VSTRQVKAQFDTSADIVSRLGAELFTDTSQALLELVKNSYDADATKVELEIRRTETEGQKSRLTLQDNGTGMTEKTIRDSWLRLSFSAKREQKRRKRTTKRNRTPLGDKGLGRLGAQLLGRTLEIRTRPQGESLEHTVRFEFPEFTRSRTLSEVPLEWRVDSEPSSPWPFRARHGTIITIEDLVEADVWADPAQLRRELGRLINPFGDIESFELSATVDGEEVEVSKLSRNVRESAMQRWQVSYDGTGLTLRGAVRSPWFQARDKKRNEILQRALQGSEGRARLVERLQAGISEYAVAKSAGPWLLRMERKISLEEIAGLPEADPDCGPFEMEIDVIARDFSIAQAASLSVFDAAKEYRDWLEEHGDVRIYREGFVVASDYDLLRLGKGFTKAASFYSLRPANVLGYVALTAAGNPELEETTDREGFRDNHAFRRFDALLVQVRDEINRVLDAAGRTGSEFAKELQAEHDEAADAEGLAEEAKSVAVAATDAQGSVAEAGRGIGAMITANPELSEDDQQALSVAQDALGKAGEALEDAKRLAPAAEGVAGDFAELQENFEDLYETIGLGLAAEGLAHEITHVIQRLGERARLAQAEVASGPQVGPNLTILAEEVDSAARGLRSQLKHLDPQLRLARTRRSTVDLGEFVGEIAAYHRDRLASAAIEVKLTKSRPGTAWLSPGRLSQVLDNLILNAEYWVRREVEENGDSGTITLAVSGTKIEVSDSGPGVPEDMLEAVFRPYVSMKANGRGLGLFIARQLLEIDGGSLSLRSSRGGRHTVFVVDLSEARRENLG
jgi:signal transduction histidine kinase